MSGKLHKNCLPGGLYRSIHTNIKRLEDMGAVGWKFHYNYFIFDCLLDGGNIEVGGMSIENQNYRPFRWQKRHKLALEPVMESSCVHPAFIGHIVSGIFRPIFGPLCADVFGSIKNINLFWTRKIFHFRRVRHFTTLFSLPFQNTKKLNNPPPPPPPQKDTMCSSGKLLLA